MKCLSQLLPGFLPLSFPWLLFLSIFLSFSLPLSVAPYIFPPYGPRPLRRWSSNIVAGSRLAPDGADAYAIGGASAGRPGRTPPSQSRPSVKRILPGAPCTAGGRVGPSLLFLDLWGSTERPSRLWTWAWPLLLLSDRLPRGSCVTLAWLPGSGARVLLARSLPCLLLLLLLLPDRVLRLDE